MLIANNMQTYSSQGHTNDTSSKRGTHIHKKREGEREREREDETANHNSRWHEIKSNA